MRDRIGICQQMIRFTDFNRVSLEFHIFWLTLLIDVLDGALRVGYERRNIAIRRLIGIQVLLAGVLGLSHRGL